MIINKKSEGEKLILVISGRLDTNSSPKLETELRQSVGGIKELVFGQHRTIAKQEKI